MTRFAAPVLATALLALSGAAPALANGFDADIFGPVATPLRVEVVLSDSLAQRANDLPDDGVARSGSRGLRAGFATGGYLGEEDLRELLDEVREELGDDLTRYGVAQSDAAPTVLRVTLENARNNRPTFRQLAEQPSLDFESYGTGGAELSAVVLGANGETLATFRYDWYDTLRGDGFDRATGIWTDANRAISRFSKRTAKALRRQTQPVG